MFKNVLGRLACFLNMHSFGDWTWLDHTNHYYAHVSCTKMSTCQRCGIVTFKDTSHTFSEWEYPSPCEKLRKCMHCNCSERIVLHSWNWKDISSDACHHKEEGTCHKCGEKTTKVTEQHTWGEYHLSPELRNIRTCALCGEEQSYEEPLTNEVSSSPDYNSDDYNDIGSGWTGVGPTGRG